MKNLPRLTNPFIDLTGTEFSDSDPVSFVILSPPLTISPAVSFGSEAVSYENWPPLITPPEEHAQSLATYSSVATEVFWASPPTPPSENPTLSKQPPELDDAKPRKRHRQVYGPVKGNNKSGKNGMLRCTQCRKRRSKCVYPSLDEPCEFCVKRGYKCIKEWGPKRSQSNESLPSHSTEMIQVNTPESMEPIPLIASHRSLLYDTNLSDPENCLIRYLHNHHRGARTTSCVGILLRNLWDAYGHIPQDKTLLYASLMWESYWKDYESPGWSPKGTPDFFAYKGKFRDEFSKSSKSGSINECHFFALFLASQSSKSGIPEFTKELHKYQREMVRIWKELMSGEKCRPLMKLYKFIVSFSRRIMCRGDFSMPEYLVEDAAKIESDGEMQLVNTRSLPAGQMFSNLPQPAVQHLQDHELHEWDYWNRTDCCLCKEFAMMADCFQMVVATGGLTADDIRTTRIKLDKMVNIHDISYVFRTMNDAFEPLNVRQGHPHERGLINFLISLFRASALLLVLEFLLDGEVEEHRRVFEEFRRAEEIVAQYDQFVWSSRKTELLSAMGLILAPYLYQEQAYLYQEQAELKERREWLTDLWERHCKDERFPRLGSKVGRCKSLERVRRLWETEMERSDYIHFLSENSWIWSMEPGWSMEKTLTKQSE